MVILPTVNAVLACLLCRHVSVDALIMLYTKLGETHAAPRLRQECLQWSFKLLTSTSASPQAYWLTNVTIYYFSILFFECKIADRSHQWMWYLVSVSTICVQKIMDFVYASHSLQWKQTCRIKQEIKLENEARIVPIEVFLWRIFAIVDKHLSR